MHLDEIIQGARELAQAYRITEGDTFRLKDIDPEDTAGLEAEDKPRAQEALQTGVQALAALQDMLYAQDRWAVLLIFQAMDAAGKDSAIKHVMSGVNPQGCQVVAFKSPVGRGARPRLSLAVRQSTCPSAAASASSTAPTTRRSWWSACMRPCSSSSSSPPSCSRQDLWQDRLRDIRRFERYLAPQRGAHPQIFSPCLAAGAEEALPRTDRHPREAVEVLRGRRAGARATGTTTWPPTRP